MPKIFYRKSTQKLLSILYNKKCYEFELFNSILRDIFVSYHFVAIIILLLCDFKNILLYFMSEAASYQNLS